MLTIAAVRTARARDRAYKLFDDGGLYLHVLPSGVKVYRLKFRLAGREGVMTFGASDEISLPVARAKRDAARVQLDAGVDPRAAAVCEVAQIRNFEGAARAWHAHCLVGLDASSCRGGDRWPRARRVPGDRRDAARGDHPARRACGAPRD